MTGPVINIPGLRLVSEEVNNNSNNVSNQPIDNLVSNNTTQEKNTTQQSNATVDNSYSPIININISNTAVQNYTAVNKSSISAQSIVNSFIEKTISDFQQLKTNSVNVALSQIQKGRNVIDNLLSSLANKLDFIKIYERKNKNLYTYSATLKGALINAHIYEMQKGDETEKLSLNLQTQNIKFHEYIKVSNNNVKYSLNIETQNYKLHGYFKGNEANYTYSFVVNRLNKKPEVENSNNKELTLTVENTKNNPSTIRVGNLELKAWIQKTPEGNYKIFFNGTAVGGNVSNYVLTLLNNQGEKPKYVGANPYVANLKEGQSTIQYWTPVLPNEFPVKINISLPSENTEKQTESVKLTKLVGSAKQEGSKVILTPPERNKGGAVWSNQEVELTKNFEVKAKLYLGNRPQGADGIAFVIQNSPQGNKALGALGGGLGYAGIPNSVAVEFDTWKNPKDINGNHLAFDVGGNVADSKKVFILPHPLESGKEIPVTIKWNYLGNNRAQMEVNIFGKTYSYQINDIEKTFGGKKAYIGFTAATGGEYNLQYINDIILKMLS